MEDRGQYDLTPPPYVGDKEGHADTIFTITANSSIQSTSQNSSQLLSITTYAFEDAHERRTVFTAMIPKKREGWKAQIDFITEKNRHEVRA